jgi:hypothetical protein
VTSKGTKGKGAAPAAPEGHCLTIAVAGISRRFVVPVYEPHHRYTADHFGENIAASKLRVDRNGFTFTLPAGEIRFAPERWDRIVDQLDVGNGAEGEAAAAVFAECYRLLGNLTRGRGDRGRGAGDLAMKETIEAEALVAAASGLSLRNAVAAALIEHWPSATITEENSVRRRIERLLGKPRI